MFFRFVTRHSYDRQTDGQIELRSQYRASIAASRGKNEDEQNHHYQQQQQLVQPS